MDVSTVKKWEATGFFFIISVGTLLHFCFEWSGGNALIAPFCAVNESVWEHLKLAFWPGLFFAMIEYLFWGSESANFLTAKALSLYAAPIAIIVLFYSYTAILGTHMPVIDILVFVISVLLGQCISFLIIVSEKDYSRFNKTALLLLAIEAMAFIHFTYNPPEHALFIDPRTGESGIPE